MVVGRLAAEDLNGAEDRRQRGTQLRRRKLDLGAVVSEVVDATRTLITAKAQTVSVTLPEAPIFVDTDPTRLTPGRRRIGGCPASSLTTALHSRGAGEAA